MAEGRRNSVDMPISKTLVALRRVRSLRDPDTNSMSKFVMGIDSISLHDGSCNNADKMHVGKVRNCAGRGRLEDIGSNSDSDSDSNSHYASSKKSTTVRIRQKEQKKGGLVTEPYFRNGGKKLVEPSWSDILDEEVNSYSETRNNGMVGKKKAGYYSWRKPCKAVEDIAISQTGSPYISTSEAQTRCSSRNVVVYTNEDVDIVDTSYSGCGISYCWSRTPKYRDPILSPDVETEENPLLCVEGREVSGKEIVPYPETPRSLSQKFRPKSFSDLVGLDAVAKSLLYAISKGKIALLYLFHGPRGTGKTSTARIFAAALNCQSLEEDRPCGLCRECVLLFSGRSRDVKELDAAKINRKDRVKALLKSASLAPFSSHYKVFIIDECQFLKGETWAALLSSVEHVSRHSVFIMLTTDPDKLPHSSLSQCQKFHFPKIKDLDISNRLQKICIEEGLEFDKDALDFVAAKCNGSLRDGETILDQLGLLGKTITLSVVYELIGVVSDEELLDLLDLALSSDTTNTVRRARDLMRSRIDPMQLVSQLANLIMDILSGRNQSDISEADRIIMGRHALAAVGMQKLRHALKVLSETEKQLRTSKNQATWLTVALLQFGTRDDGDLSSTSPRDSLKNVGCYEDRCNRLCSGTRCCEVELETIWRRALRKCQSNPIKRFLQKDGNLSSIHVNEGLAIAEIEFFHPDHVSRAEKSWKVIAASLQDVLGCDVQLRLKLIPTHIRKRAKVKKPSFSLLSCSGRKQQISDSAMSEKESETSTIGEPLSRTHSSCKGLQVESKRMQEVFFHNKVPVTIRKTEEDTQSSKSTSDRCATVNLQNEYKSRTSKKYDEESQCIDIQEHERQPNCFSKTLKLRRRFLSSEAAQSICLKAQPQSKQELTIPKTVVSATYFNTYDPYSMCARSNADVTYNSGEDNVSSKESKFGSKFLCWRSPRSPPERCCNVDEHHNFYL